MVLLKPSSFLGQSGGLWLLWKGDFSLDVVQASANLILVNAVYKPLGLNFSLICIYGHPHHNRTDTIWQEVLDFVVKYSDMPAPCMGDMNNLMNANEKLGPNPVNFSRIDRFCHWQKSRHRSFHEKSAYLANDLKVWRRKKPQISVQLEQLENLIIADQQKPYT
ncbi:hypothetical protein U9M48_030398 [Paspalum notatum var. saurae]|uniref:Endonuclease/exonuclease/phosphatase domain-containing protein n=1 Tax=Paspalum notatum var. saurae TaxID=547442 RepID=A0AAQ3U2Z4_PASNO